MFKHLTLYILSAIVLSACFAMPATEPVETLEDSTVTAHLDIKYLSGETKEITTEIVPVELHRSEAYCFMTLPGEDGQKSEYSKISLNTKALQFETAANNALSSFGSSPYTFRSDYAYIMGEPCDLTDVYATVSLLVDYGDQEGGFLKFSNNKDHESAFIYLPVSFYDFVLSNVVTSGTGVWDLSYPQISQVGGYQVETGDPNRLIAWMNGQVPFLEKVYGRSTEVVTSSGTITYQTRTVESRTTGYGCLNYNYRGVCTDRGALTEKYYAYQDHQVEGTIGSLVLK